MRLTQVVNHAKHFYWGKFWGPKPRRDTSHRMFKVQWLVNSKRKVFKYDQALPPGVTVLEPNLYLKKAFEEELSPDRKLDNFSLPWPFSPRPIKGSPEDPLYQSTSALTFNRHRRLLDPINQSLVFTNTICEADQQLPESVSHLTNHLEIDQQFLDLIDRRIKWCTTSDGMLRKLPIDRQFPYLDQRPPRVWGVPINRKEINYLRTLYDLSQILVSKHFGFVDTFKISYPHCVVPFQRNDKLVVLDLETEFITTAKSDNSLPLFSTTPLVTIDKPLTSIAPLSWTTCFNEKNIYPTDWSFKIPPNNNIHTIFLTHNNLRTLENDNFVGRAIVYCYGYAVASARLLYGDQINDKELPDPIPIQCVYINPKDFSLGFVCFQLNTTSFESSLKNQVWISGPHLDFKDIMKNLVAFQINGFVDNVTRNLKTAKINA